MNPREISARFLLQSRCLLGLSVLLFLVSTPPQLGKVWKAIATGAAGVALGAAWIQRRQWERYEPMAGVYSRHELQAFGQFLQTQSEMSLAAVSGMWETVNAQVLGPAEQPLLPTQTFDWQRFNSEPDEFAHLAIVGPTGSGKSTLAEALATQLGGTTIAIAPHRKPGDFKALGDRVYCGGRNYGTAKDKPGDFGMILDGSEYDFSVVEIIRSLYGEMHHRFNLFDRGEDVGPFVNVIWDEILAALDECPKALVPCLKRLLRESRKVGIRLIVLPQDDQVESLHIKGNGAIRRNLTYVRLGKDAIAHAKSVGKETLAQVMTQRRPCIVEEMPAIVPEYNPAMVSPVGDVPSSPTPKPPIEVEPSPFAADLNDLFNLDEPVVVGRDEDEKFLAIIQKFGEGKNVVTPSQLKSNRNALRKLSTEAIALLLEKLATRGIGAVMGDAGGLKWHPPTKPNNTDKPQ